MKEREESVPATTPGLVSTPLAKATKHVADLWFPVNEGLFNQIKSSVRTGKFDQDLESLIKDVSGDYSLFFYCLRELARMLKEEDPDLELPANLSPSKMLAWGGLDRLKKILDVEVSDISSHSFRGVNEVQKARFQEAMVSATTSEQIAPSFDVDSDMAYSAALLRQLGVTLIAWNYPIVYQKAVAQLASGVSLDMSLTQMFGFSPALLAVNVVRRWELPKQLFHSIVDEPAGVMEGWDDAAESAAIARTISKICRTGEALARANNPKMYPTASNDWEFARVEIEKALGPDGLRMLQEKLSENCLQYAAMVPHVFTPAFVLDPEGHIGENRRDEMLKRNPQIENCRPFLKKKLASFYEQLRPFEVSRENIQLLTREIIPSCGYHQGVVFTIDPATQLLVPQLVIGTALLKHYAPVKYNALIAGTDQHGRLDDVVAEAFTQDAPVVRVSLPARDPEEISVAGPLGYSQRVGVLFLEIRSASYHADEAIHLTHFRALLQAFNDCLLLK